MLEPTGMPQLMNGFFGCTPGKERAICRPVVSVFPQARQGDHRAARSRATALLV